MNWKNRLRTVSVAGCSTLWLTACAGIDSTLSGFVPGDCPDPPGITAVQQKKMLKFTKDVAKIVGAVAGDAAEKEIRARVKSYYPAVADLASKLQALGYSGCVACRSRTTDEGACAQVMRQVYRSQKPEARGEALPADVQAAMEYSEAQLRGLASPEG